jgi:hypothetical protein
MFTITGLSVLAGVIAAPAQEASAPVAQAADSVAGAVHDLQEQVRELRAAIQELRTEAVEYRAETLELRRELQATRGQTTGSTAQAPPVEERVAALEESSQLLNSKVDDQYQTKVESASKYHVRLSGLLLFNLFGNHGYVDNQDFPTWVVPPDRSTSGQTFGASLRQSELGLEVFGPRVAGAKTTGELRFDFSGGFPNTLNGASYGLVRMRIADLRMDWGRTSVVAGQDAAFISPLAPTSFASVSVPALAYTGNLWGWIPQLRVEHRFNVAEGQNLSLQAGILDSFTGEPPDNLYLRQATAGEGSGQPAYATRVAWTRNLRGQSMTLGASGYYGRQDWGLDRKVDAWGAITDWEVPLAARVSLTGEFYRGRAMGGFGGAFGRSVIFSGPEFTAGTQVRALNSVGGWCQLKVRASAKLEFNGAFGLDNPYAQDLRAFATPQAYFPAAVAQNRGELINFIYRPRSDLLFAGEYRHLRTFEIFGTSPTAEQVSMTMGVLF